MWTFKAKIQSLLISGTTEIINANSENDYTFSRSKIFVDEKQLEAKPALHPFGNYVLKNQDRYTFDKVFDDNDNLRFQIKFENEYCAYLVINRKNKIICNIIHHRYFIDRNKEKLYEILIAAAIGFLFSLIGYKKGFTDGKNDSKQAQEYRLQSNLK